MKDSSGDGLRYDFIQFMFICFIFKNLDASLKKMMPKMLNHQPLF